MRSPRLSLTRRQLRLGMKLCERAIESREASLVGLNQELTDADAAFMAIRGELTPRDRLFHPVARRKIWARADVASAYRDIIELRDLRARMSAALEKER